jgi:DNA-damage-inducible protein D
MNLDLIISKLEGARKFTDKGIEYWIGREIQAILGYSQWRDFDIVIRKAKMACESTGKNPEYHFVEQRNLITAGKGAIVKKGDYLLSRYACYLIAMSGNTPEAGLAKGYFAVQTRRQEIQDSLTEDEKRLMLRDRVKDANKALCKAAKQAGVQRYGIFQNEGYKGLYNLSFSEIKDVKGLRPNEDILDRMGRTELAANEFRITQTEDKLKRENIKGEQRACDTHFKVGRAVRDTIKELGGIMPEDLPTESPIKKLISEKKKQLKSKTPKHLPEKQL